ncbi:phospholipid-binding protein [Pleomorphomonas sp. PLEO]|uniref:phospholipid-binding protein n=1 Tax=Pleomorphomonas sp. PLEO TaxID=3239306 RepID=UPI00351E645A
MLRSLAAAVVLVGLTLPAAAFELSFTWGATPACDSGRPSVVASPEFHLANVPPGTRVIVFEMIDLNAPDFHHGGGTVSYAGDGLVQAGAFRYLGPCPPAGPHRYMWTATARDRGTTFGRTLDTASATRSFPN